MDKTEEQIDTMIDHYMSSTEGYSDRESAEALVHDALKARDTLWRKRIEEAKLEKSGVPELEFYMWGTNIDRIIDVKRYNELTDKFNARLDTLLQESDNGKITTEE